MLCNRDGINEAERNGKNCCTSLFFPKYFKANSEHYVFPTY